MPIRATPPLLSVQLDSDDIIEEEEEEEEDGEAGAGPGSLAAAGEWNHAIPRGVGPASKCNCF